LNQAAPTDTGLANSGYQPDIQLNTDGTPAAWPPTGASPAGVRTAPARCWFRAGGLGRPFACAIATDHPATCWGDDTVDQ